jgi:hypothetical protein
MYYSLPVALIVAARISLRLLFPRPKYNETMKRKYIFEVISLTQEAKSRGEKVDILHTNMSAGLAGILRLNFDPDLFLDVDLDAPYLKRKEHDELETLSHSSKLWHTFTKDSNVPEVRKNLRFKSMLERLEPREAATLIQAAKKQIKIGLSKATLKQCFPQILKTQTRGKP